MRTLICSACGRTTSHNRACPFCGAPPPDAEVGQPQLCLTVNDHSLIERYVHTKPSLDPSVRAILLDKLDSCQTVPPDSIAPDVVTLDSRALFVTDEGEMYRSIVLEPQFAVPGATLPLASPIGATLIGLRAPALASFVDSQGEQRRLILRDVAYQPEANARQVRSWRQRITGGVPDDGPGVA